MSGVRASAILKTRAIGLVLVLLSTGQHACEDADRGTSPNTSRTSQEAFDPVQLEYVSSDLYLDQWFQAEMLVLIGRFLDRSTGRRHYLYTAFEYRILEKGRSIALSSNCDGSVINADGTPSGCLFWGVLDSSEDRHLNCTYSWMTGLGGFMEFHTLEVDKAQTNPALGSLGSFGITVRDINLRPLSGPIELFNPGYHIVPSILELSLEPRGDSVAIAGPLVLEGRVSRYRIIDPPEKGAFGSGCR